MAAIQAERVREIFELHPQDISVLPSSLRRRSDGMIEWTSTDRHSGLAGILTETDERYVAAQALYCATSLVAVGRTHQLQTPTPGSTSKIGRRFGSRYFAGIMADSGSTKYLHSSARRKAFTSHSGRPPETRRAHGGGMPSLGGRGKIRARVEFGFPPNNSPIAFSSRETDGDAPLLPGVRDMHRPGMEYLTNLYAIRWGSTLIPTVRDQGHLFIS